MLSKFCLCGFAVCFSKQAASVMINYAVVYFALNESSDREMDIKGYRKPSGLN